MCEYLQCVSVCVCVMSPITRGWAWECVECRVTSMVTFPEPRVPGQQLRTTDPREEEEDREKERGGEEEKRAAEERRREEGRAENEWK